MTSELTRERAGQPSNKCQTRDSDKTSELTRERAGQPSNKCQTREERGNPQTSVKLGKCPYKVFNKLKYKIFKIYQDDLRN